MTFKKTNTNAMQGILSPYKNVLKGCRNQQTQSRFQRAFSRFYAKKMPKENPTLSDEADSASLQNTLRMSTLDHHACTQDTR